MKKALLIFSFFLFSEAFSQSYLEFVENKGQWAENIAYKGLLQTGAIALKPDGGYRMLQNSPNDLETIHEFYHPTKGTNVAVRKTTPSSLGLHSHVYEVSFLGCNPTPQVIAEKPQESYNNYYIDNDPKHWASGCKIFQAVTYKNIYPNIDVRYYTGNGTLKYDFIVNPGGNPNQIVLVFDGADEMKIKKGNLIIKTSVTEEKELSPYTFQPSNDGRKKIECSYHLKQNILTFNIDDYDKSLPLIIDPVKVFATFTGSTADNWGFTATYDALGNFYAGGIVFDHGQFPVTNGTTYQGGFTDDAESYEGSDIGIIKFNSAGTKKLFATYLGGSLGNEQPHSLVVDASGNLIIAGRTNSGNYPVTLANVGTCAGRDIIITKLNSLGNIIASRKIGGSSDDGVNIKPKYAKPYGIISLNRNYGDDARSEVIVDDAGNILLASSTQSIDFPVSANAFQKTSGSAASAMTRKQDAVFIKVSNDLSTIITSTYLGGNNDDAAFVLAINPNNKNIYIAGGTASTDFPGDKTNVIHSNFQGGVCDGFVSIIDGITSQLLKSCYMGTSGSENLYGIQFDKSGFPYIMGTTTGQWPIFNATYNIPFSKQFIAKLKPDLSDYVYSTTFGTSVPMPNISPTAFLVDRCDNVYVSGWGGIINSTLEYLSSGTSGLPVTANAMQKTTDGKDFYFFVLERDAKSQLYGDFFGQNGGTCDHVDGGTSRFDKNGIIYQSLCANCGGPSDIFPTTPGAYSRINGSSNCNLAAVKIAMNFAGIGAGVRSSIKGVQGDTSGCVPLLINFSDTIAEGKQYTWDFGDGSSSIITATPKVSHVYNNVGYYTVRLISVDSSTCNIVDTSYKTMRIRSDSATLNLVKRKVGDCYSYTYQFDNTGSTASPGKPFKNNSFLINFGDGSPAQAMGFGNITHSYPTGGIYNGWMALVDTNYCNTPDTFPIHLNIIANIKAQFTPPATGCIGKSINFINSSLGGDNVVWYFNNSDSSNENNPQHIFNNSGTYTIKLIVRDTFSCNKIDSISHTITISASPIALYTYSPNPPKVNTAVSFNNKSTGAINYLWNFGDGDSIKTNNINESIKHFFPLSQLFHTCLKVTNVFGCIDTFCNDIQAKVDALFDVPNALAPEGRNNKIFVKGYSIKKIDWNIYNRWGALMFSTNDVKEGWDGRYKGEIQPQDVYHYTLIVQFYDGKKATKTGDITLVR